MHQTQHHIGVQKVLLSQKSLSTDLKSVPATQICPDFLNCDVFLCGPVEMMKSVEGTLLQLGLPAERLHQEVFTF